jgi:hypothetical protein
MSDEKIFVDGMGWVNIQCKTSKGGKHYAELDTFQPSEKAKHDAGMEQARAAVEDPGFSDLEEPPF